MLILHDSWHFPPLPCPHPQRVKSHLNATVICQVDYCFCGLSLLEDFWVLASELTNWYTRSKTTGQAAAVLVCPTEDATGMFLSTAGNSQRQFSSIATPCWQRHFCQLPSTRILRGNWDRSHLYPSCLKTYTLLYSAPPNSVPSPFPEMSPWFQSILI